MRLDIYIYIQLYVRQDRHCNYNVTLRSVVRLTIVVVENKCELHIDLV